MWREESEGGGGQTNISNFQNHVALRREGTERQKYQETFAGRGITAGDPKANVSKYKKTFLL